MENSLLLLFGTTFIFGLRHGIDWDHIAAISTLTGADKKEKQLLTSSFYIFGHAAIVLLLGLCAVVLGVTLPNWVDKYMEPVVGLTLILLGFWLIYSLRSNKKELRLLSSWMVFFTIFKQIHTYIHSSFHKQEANNNHVHKNVRSKDAFLIGIIHGIGAETPTQMLLFLTVTGIGGKSMGVLLLFIFILGLILSNFFISFISIQGYTRVQKNKPLFIGFSLASGLLSIIIGLLFLTGRNNLLPVIFGG